MTTGQGPVTPEPTDGGRVAEELGEDGYWQYPDPFVRLPFVETVSMSETLRRALRLLVLAIAVAAVQRPMEAPAGEGTRFALLIGINKYRNLGRLNTCGADARELARVLIERAGFPEDQVILMTDDADRPQNLPTMGNLLNRFEQISILPRADDAVLVFFSGHGVTVEGEGFLVPADGSQRNAIPLKSVKSMLEKCEAKAKLLVLDCCHAGSASKGVSSIAPTLVKKGANLAMLLSSGAGQSSYMTEDETHSIFTRYLLHGLSGAADKSKDNSITVKELHGYLRLQMMKWCFKSGKTQVPVVYPDPAPDTVLALVPKPTGRPGSSEHPPQASLLPKTLRAAYVVPVKSIDQYGNPVAKGIGLKTRFPAEIWHRKTGMEFILVEPGAFPMGSKLPAREVAAKYGGKEDYFTDDHPQHEVTLTRPFYLGKYEVTFAQFSQFVASTGYKTDAERDEGAYVWTGTDWQKRPGMCWREPGFEQTPRHPVACLSWDDAGAFCEWSGMELPTEAEWEYACRADSRTVFPWGDEATGAAGQANVADETTVKRSFGWETFREVSDGYPYAAPVGSFRPNQWGLYDMVGNVFEWCRDWYGSDYYEQSEARDPQGPPKGEYRVLRGGSWFGYPGAARSPNRDRDHPKGRNSIYGCRVKVRIADEK